jgi:hypothetical protein
MPRTSAEMAAAHAAKGAERSIGMQNALGRGERSDPRPQGQGATKTPAGAMSRRTVPPIRRDAKPAAFDRRSGGARPPELWRYSKIGQPSGISPVQPPVVVSGRPPEAGRFPPKNGAGRVMKKRQSIECESRFRQRPVSRGKTAQISRTHQEQIIVILPSLGIRTISRQSCCQF